MGLNIAGACTWHSWVRLRWIRGYWSQGTYILHDSLLGANDVAIFESVQSIVDVGGCGGFNLDFLNGTLDVGAHRGNDLIIKVVKGSLTPVHRCCGERGMEDVEEKQGDQEDYDTIHVCMPACQRSLADNYMLNLKLL